MNRYYVHGIDPFVLKFPESWPVDGIRWYGIFYIFAFAFAALALNFYTKKNKSPLSAEQNSSFLGYAIIGVVIGGRLGYALLYSFDSFIKNPLEIFAVWRGGMSSHGGFAGVIAAIAIFCKKNNVPLLSLADICSTIAPFGFFVGRIANFINGELYGKITAVKWAVIFPKSAHQMANILAIPARHPSQLYEAFLEGLVLFLCVQTRFWSRREIRPGRLSGEFLVLYAIFRIFTECFREPDAELIFSMARGQFYSIFLLILGLILIFLPAKDGKFHGDDCEKTPPPTKVSPS
ncbi:MAG: prolipoprotein diacylglyceryl transferase [Puniceicoccales bacterium]|jgi:phosphatidylglycerol:prolipoprotein diacylglycerol transferase|nr:prolipoprotein diacylglyceryl transferase [Puniceicoccales bacterium]